jgi:hypothetical protein
MTPAAALLHGLKTISMTCVVDGKAHEITDDAVAAGHAARAGNYCALCGHRVLPAPLIERGGAPCQNCLATLHAGRRPERRDGRTPGQHRHPVARRGLSWLRGLLHAPFHRPSRLHLPPKKSRERARRAPAAAASEFTPTSSEPAASHQTRAAR